MLMKMEAKQHSSDGSIFIKNLGDKHNFGKQVQLSSRGGTLLIHKPRPIYWEYLFLDKESFIRTTLDNLLNSSTSNYLGSLNYLKQSNEFFDGGFAEFIHEDFGLQGRSESFLENFGRILAFVTTFGISDLHHENWLIKGTRLQIIDIECVFSDFQSPLDSLLLREKSLKKIIDLNYEIVSKKLGLLVATIVEGMLAEFTFFNNNSKNILESFEKLHNIDLKIIPIRFLIRPTQHYISEEKLEFPFLVEERVQMARGDIPYFFGYLGQKKLYYLSENSKQQQVELPFDFPLTKKIERSFSALSKLMNETRINLIAKNSVMVVLNRLLFGLRFFDFENDNIKIRIIDESIHFEGYGFNLNAQKYRFKNEIS